MTEGHHHRGAARRPTRAVAIVSLVLIAASCSGGEDRSTDTGATTAQTARTAVTVPDASEPVNESTTSTGVPDSEGATDVPDQASTTVVSSSTSSDPGCASAGTVPRDGAHTLEVGGTKRRYLLHTPTVVDGPAPLIVDLHGFTATAEEQDQLSGMASAGTGRGYVVVTPQGLDAQVGASSGPLWNFAAAYAGPDVDAGEVELPDDDDISFINTLIDHIERRLCIDPRREYVTGMSAGAGMTTWLICQDGSRFAAAAPVAGVTQGKSCPSRSIPPMIIFHGDADSAVPYDGGDLAGIPLDIPAVEERAHDFAERQGCQQTPTRKRIGVDIVHVTWICPDDGGLELYKVIGGGHTWPGSAADPSATRTIDATSLILDFFDAHHG